MRKLLASVIVLGLLAGTSTLAQNQDQDHHDKGGQQHQNQQRQTSNRPAQAHVERVQQPQRDRSPAFQHKPDQSRSRGVQRLQQNRIHATAHQQVRQLEQRRELNTQRAHVQQQQRHLQVQRTEVRQHQRQLQGQRAQIERRQVRHAVVLQNERRWDRVQDRSWYESRWGSRARNFDARIYRRAFDSPRRYQIGAYARPSGWYYRRWGVGANFPMAWVRPNYFIDSWVRYGLLAPPWGYEWVRYGPDVVLVDVRTGRILQARYNVFY